MVEKEEVSRIQFCKINVNNQITIPFDVRDILGVKEGDTVEVKFVRKVVPMEKE